MKATPYFEQQVLRKRPYIRREWCEQALSQSVRREVAPGVVLDFDAEGHVVGIDSDHASKIVDLSKLEAESLPVTSGAPPKR